MSPSCPLSCAATLHTWCPEEQRGEEAQARQVWGLYKAPNEGLLTREDGGRHAALVWGPCCWSCAYYISNTVSATVTLTSAAVAMVIVARFHCQFGALPSNKGETPGQRSKVRYQYIKHKDRHGDTGGRMSTENKCRVDWSWRWLGWLFEGGQSYLYQ